jgi:hypothetical protein
MPHRVSGSRWLPHMKKGLDTLFRTYPAFITQLQTGSHSTPKAEGLARIMETFHVIAYAALLLVIITTCTDYYILKY